MGNETDGMNTLQLLMHIADPMWSHGLICIPMTTSKLQHVLKCFLVGCIFYFANDLYISLNIILWGNPVMFGMLNPRHFEGREVSMERKLLKIPKGRGSPEGAAGGPSPGC